MGAWLHWEEGAAVRLRNPGKHRTPQSDHPDLGVRDARWLVGITASQQRRRCAGLPERHMGVGETTGSELGRTACPNKWKRKIGSPMGKHEQDEVGKVGEEKDEEEKGWKWFKNGWLRPFGQTVSGRTMVVTRPVCGLHERGMRATGV